jgi:protein-tyrosine phosphatase
MPASPEAIAACAAKGIDIKAHKSRALSQQLVEESDFIYVMSQTHWQRVAALGPEASSKCVLLAQDKYIADPIGQSQQVYNSCADLIEEAVEKRISELVI